MPITFDSEKMQFHLFNDQISYIMEIVENQYLTQVYYGQRITSFNQVSSFPRIDRSSFSPNPQQLSNQGFSLNVCLQEAPGYNNGDYRDGLVAATYPDGTRATNLVYRSHQIIAGKAKLPGLPATYVNEDSEATTLLIELYDSHRQLVVTLRYTIYEQRPVITKSSYFKNESQGPLSLNRALSACVDFPTANFDVIQMPGDWAREKQLQRQAIMPGIHSLESKRGASGVAQQPFIALADPKTDDLSGEVYGFHFVYSGNFKISTEVDPWQQTRVLVGINPFNFNWLLKPGEAFQAPEVVLVYSNTGLNGMSQSFHDLYRDRLARGKFQHEQRPVLINNWETTYFDFDEQKLLELADDAKKLGVELFVLDDGWFGKRNSDTTSLGDWFVNPEKLPNGLKGLVDQIHAKGLKFGLWFEPEMVSEESDLFKEHPDWHIHVDDYPTSLGRNQLILDFSRPEVREAIFEKMTAILDHVPIDYIKWDMNRNMTEVGSTGRAAEDQLKTSHLYMLGLYAFLEKLTTRYPNILFENCSGGAGRFDAGMVYYMPQSWTSDNTDAIERLKIQYSTSFMFPPIMMCSHISESPNHQIGRQTPFETRATVAMAGNLGIMLDLKKQTAADIALLKKDIQWYKNHRALIQFGTFYRLLNPYDNRYGAFEFLNQDGGLIYFVEILPSASKPWLRLKLEGLDPDSFYDINNQRLSGSELINYGIYMNTDLFGDFQSKLIEFKKVK